MTERLTRAVPAHEQWFVHVMAVFPLSWQEGAAPTEDPPRLVSRCMTRRPGAQCECGMFTLDWEEKPGCDA